MCSTKLKPSYETIEKLALGNFQSNNNRKCLFESLILIDIHQTHSQI